MLDIAVAYNKYKFIGNEYLTWLWYVIDTEKENFSDNSNTPFILEIGNKIVFETIIDDNTIETVTIKGDNASLEEGLMALKKGAVVTELHLKLMYIEQIWSFNLKGENFHFTGFKHPETEQVENKEEVEGAVLEKVYLFGKAVELMDGVFKKFIQLRISDDWNKITVPEIKEWIRR